ncbi:MAG: hypothetical protein ACKOYM_01380 [Actinomycetes bacterium]
MYRVRGFLTLAAVLAVVAVGCTPPPAPLPDPILTCEALSGSITYDPPADSSGADVHLEIQSASLAGCVDHTGGGVTSARILGTFVLLEFTCGVKPAGSEIGTGIGRFDWSNGTSSDFSAVLRSPGSPNQFGVEFRITSGRWAGATADVQVGVVSSVGNCVQVPVTEAVLGSLEPFVLHPRT